MPKTLLSAGPSSGGAAKGSSSNESTCKIEWVWRDRERERRRGGGGGSEFSNISHFYVVLCVYALCMSLQPSSDIPNYRPGVLENSPKMVVLVELVDRSVQLGDKILIFRFVSSFQFYY